MPANRPINLTVRAVCALLGIAVLAGCRTPMSSWQDAKDFRIGRRDNFKNPEKTHLAFAKLSEQTKDFTAARESYEVVLDHNPESVEATIGLAGLDLRAGEIASAEKRFRKAYQLAPADPLVTEALGQFYLSQKRYAEAERYLSAGLQTSPMNKRLGYRLGVTLARQGRIDEAEPHLVRSVGDAEADYNLGLILYEDGNPTAAAHRFTAALMKKPTLQQAQHWLSVVRNEHSDTMMAAGQPNRQNTLRHGVVNQVAGTQHAQQAAFGSLNLASRQVLQEQQDLLQRQAVTQSGVQTIPQQTAPQHQTAQVQVGVPQQATLQSQQPVQAPHMTQVIQQPVQQYQTLDTSRMTATQWEQLQNSMTPQQRAALQQQLQPGIR